MAVAITSLDPMRAPTLTALLTPALLPLGLIWVAIPASRWRGRAPNRGGEIMSTAETIAPHRGADAGTAAYKKKKPKT